jgi:hypothetical protein
MVSKAALPQASNDPDPVRPHRPTGPQCPQTPLIHIGPPHPSQFRTRADPGPAHDPKPITRIGEIRAAVTNPHTNFFFAFLGRRKALPPFPWGSPGQGDPRKRPGPKTSRDL